MVVVFFSIVRTRRVREKRPLRYSTAHLVLAQVKSVIIVIIAIIPRDKPNTQPFSFLFRKFRTFRTWRIIYVTLSTLINLTNVHFFTVVAMSVFFSTNLIINIQQHAIKKETLRQKKHLLWIVSSYLASFERHNAIKRRVTLKVPRVTAAGGTTPRPGERTDRLVVMTRHVTALLNERRRTGCRLAASECALRQYNTRGWCLMNT